MRLSLLSIIFFSLAALFAGCGKNIEEAQEAAADITAAQIEGRNEAKRFINRPWEDTVELQGQLLEARAKQSKYVLRNQPKCAAAYDSAFVATLRTVRPEIAAELPALDKK